MEQKRRKMYTKSEKIALVRLYLTSGQPICSFARENSISRNTIRIWTKEFAQDLLEEKPILKEMSTEEELKHIKEELKQAKLKIKQLEADMEYKTAESEAWKKMVEMTEQIYHINVKKKLRCQVIDEMIKEKKHKIGITDMCNIFKISRQGYYQHIDRLREIDILYTSLVLYCQYLRDPSRLPKAGCRELYVLCCEHFKEKMVIGKDQFFNLLRVNGLMLKIKRFVPKTTNSNHNYKIHPDLLNTTPKFVAQRPGELIVVDITYVATKDGWAYLSLVTDAYSRAIVGYALHQTLDTQGPLSAIKMAIDFYKEHNIDISNMIHHSDRGCQYCSNAYVDYLKTNNIRISMTQCGDPLHNALAERMNNTIKNGWLFDCEHDSFQKVKEKIDNAVLMYNTLRPHQALNMRTPFSMIM